MVERTLGICCGASNVRGGENRLWATKTEDMVPKERNLYLELSHLLELQPEFGHTAPHVQQAHVDG